MASPRNIFVLTGAGVSAESGLGTFRDRGGMWSRFDPMTLATPEAFARDPALVHEFYNLRRSGVIAAAPNPAHTALAALETHLRDRGGALFLCTQNVDDLHTRAGNRAVMHMHGELLKARCLACETVHPWRDDLFVGTPCPACNRAGSLRPDIVWFGEMPKHLEAIDAALRTADVFVAVGTSGAVYPAAGYVAQARTLGIRTWELNLEPSDNARLFDAARYGPASVVVPEFITAL
ncbi:NAD-dependent deacylase [Methylobacterium haplocladii]|uniref:NAD-dependent protein deacylase n=1 Tax=Methylobacterium haplocladii TaxID=1176176 RepID=A0A512IVW9_9HYPH|nr:NAD-dependent deacylase [Methylobacterium haplocladii]GEP01870.1 NAD-dependent protein deacylase [Methylobacterium haplocladii]GJD86405.1 NAD-dependent protein deacylase [Methylobacterium haplocladii]GLS61295.1 NAD-dependent protein deacylase [Methylobacterium haplocladii]